MFDYITDYICNVLLFKNSVLTKFKFLLKEK